MNVRAWQLSTTKSILTHAAYTITGAQLVEKGHEAIMRAPRDRFIWWIEGRNRQ